MSLLQQTQGEKKYGSWWIAVKEHLPAYCTLFQAGGRVKKNGCAYDAVQQLMQPPVPLLFPFILHDQVVQTPATLLQICDEDFPTKQRCFLQNNCWRAVAQATQQRIASENCNNWSADRQK